MPTYLLDTCIFNWVKDGKIDLEELPKDGLLAVTSVQLFEIDRCTEPRRTELRAALNELAPEHNAPMRSLRADISRADVDLVGLSLHPDSVYERVKFLLIQKDPKPGKLASHELDAEIASSAAAVDARLLTCDANLHAAMMEAGLESRLLRNRP
ncbi:hypothetical protein [Rhizobacter sp. Root1221]|uniref:hypothetical protein n=1 Tax=Rhizobacter sp. Root1221 TaxID=1736433 RepID=UPI0006F9ADAF|nr:hypothetical protein [Rhizobacter sp. Root1221]